MTTSFMGFRPLLDINVDGNALPLTESGGWLGWRGGEVSGGKQGDGCYKGWVSEGIG